MIKKEELLLTVIFLSFLSSFQFELRQCTKILNYRGPFQNITSLNLDQPFPMMNLVTLKVNRRIEIRINSDPSLSTVRVSPESSNILR